MKFKFGSKAESALAAQCFARRPRPAGPVASGRGLAAQCFPERGGGLEAELTDGGGCSGVQPVRRQSGRGLVRSCTTRSASGVCRYMRMREMLLWSGNSLKRAGGHRRSDVERRHRWTNTGAATWRARAKWRQGRRSTRTRADGLSSGGSS
jgi:hypothetical protein